MYNKLVLSYDKGNLVVTLTNKYLKKHHSFCKAFKGGFLDTIKGAWIIPRFLTREFCREARRKNLYLSLSLEIQKEFNVNQDGYSQKEIQKLKEWLENHESNQKDDLGFDESILEMPFPLLKYQRAGISYFSKKSRNGRGLLADDMGLGKTIQGIGLAKFYKKDWPVVVVAPASLLLNWKKEFVKWLPKDLTEDDVYVMKNGKMNPRGKVTICSFNYTIKKADKLAQYLSGRGVVLVDEAHNIKNIEAQRTQAVIKLAHSSKRYLAMTGTPLLNRPEELFSILHSIDPVEWHSYRNFMFDYCDAQEVNIKNRRCLLSTGVSNDNVLFKKLRDTLMCRRLKKDVLTQLPPKRRYTLSLDANVNEVNQTQEYLELYREIICYGLVNNDYDLEKTKRFVLSERTIDAGKGLFEAYQLTGRSKIKPLCQWLEDKIGGELNKVIIFGHHAKFLDALQTQIDGINEKKKKGDKPIGYMRIDGQTSKEKRFANQEKFQNDEDCNVAILSINAANSGLTLTAASVLIMGELPWTPGVSRQAEDRVHRIGQLNDVDIYYTIADNTLDGALWEMLQNKSMIASNILDNGEGDEMQEDIQMTSTDLLTAFLLQVNNEIKTGKIDVNKYAKDYEKKR